MPDGTEVDWDYDTIREIAKILTVDANGNDATSAEFDPTKIEQYGFEVQRDDLRGLGAYFGAGNLTGPDGKTVTIPDAWKDGWKFFYDGMWKDHFIMTGPVYETDEFNGGGYSFFSGRVAMAENFLWTTYGVAGAGTDWDLGAIPSHNGTTTSPLNADTFAVMKGSKNPDAAFAAFTYLIGDASDELLGLYGGMPARPDKQDAFFDALDASTGEDGEIRSRRAWTGRSPRTASSTPTTRTSRRTCPVQRDPHHPRDVPVQVDDEARAGHGCRDRGAPRRDPGRVGQVTSPRWSNCRPSPIAGSRSTSAGALPVRI